MPRRCFSDATATPRRCHGDATAMPRRCHGDATAMPRRCHGESPPGPMAPSDSQRPPYFCPLNLDLRIDGFVFDSPIRSHLHCTFWRWRFLPSTCRTKRGIGHLINWAISEPLRRRCTLRSHQAQKWPELKCLNCLVNRFSLIPIIGL